MVNAWSQALLTVVVLTLLGAGTSPPVVAQGTSTQDVETTGAAAGVVVDAAQGESLPGANVRIRGTSRGTTTDLSGRYRIEGLEPGSYDLVFSFVGFQRKTVTGVSVTAGETTDIDITLAEETAQMDEVVVTAEVAKNTESGLLSERQKATAVSDAISAEFISKSGAGDAAQAMKKVTGASVVGGKYVHVRGLGGRYTQAQLNGASLPSADPDGNSVQFDLFSSNQVKNIVTQKTFTPDKAGDFSGGLVNINTKDFSSELTLEYSTSFSVNTETHFNDDFLTYPGGDLDFLGFDDGTRDVPGPLAAGSLPPASQAVNEFQNGSPESLRRLEQLSESFSNAWGPARQTAPIDQSHKFSIGNEVDLFGRPLGFLLNVSYKRSASSYDNGFTGRYEPPSGSGADAGLPPSLLVDDSRGTEEAQVGGVANLNYDLTSNHSLSADVLFSNSGTSEARFQSGPWPRENTFRFDNRTLTWTERQMTSVQLRGKHYLPSVLGATVDWNASFADTQQEEPDTRFFANQATIVAGDTILGTQSAGFSEPRRIFRDLNESSYSGKLDISIPFEQWSGERGKAKFGGAYETDDRDFNEDIFVATPSSAVSFSGNEEAFFSDENVGIIRNENGDVEALGHVYANRSQSSSNYNGDRTIAAGYGMIELPLSSSLRATGGIRLETTDIEVVSQDTTAGVGRIDELDFLPALNLVYNLRDNMNLRAAASRTLARPTFREISPFSRLNGINLEFVLGNTQLDRTLITNADLRWEWFMRPGEILAVSGFYKVMDDPIEEVLLGSTNGQETWFNADQAEVFGAEFEARIRLDRFTDALQHFKLGGNVSLVNSSVDISERENTEDESRQLQGQSPYTINVNLSYEHPRGTSVGLFFNTFGERLTEVALRNTPGVFEQPVHQLNATVSQRFMDHWTVNASVENILGDDFREIQEFGGENFVYQQRDRGRTFSLGLSYKL